MSTLFTVPIEGVDGDFKVSSPKEHIYLITFTSPVDNRTTTPFLAAYLKALDILETKYERGVVISTSGITKFFSNGLDVEHTMSRPNFFKEALTPVLRRLITYPMPTVALINGHCFGAGVFMAAAHDYRIMNPTRGFWCLPEADMGLPIPATIATLFREKVPSNVYRDAVLEAARYSGPQALERGIVDGNGGLDETLALIERKKLVAMSRKGVIGHLKFDAYRNIVNAFDGFDEHTEWQRRKYEEEETASDARASKL